MTRLKHECESCDSKFSISFDELETDSDPSYCPFCASYIIDNDETDDDDDDY